MKTTFLRVVDKADKAASLRTATSSPAYLPGARFEADVCDFSVVAGSPFTYWIGSRLRDVSRSLPSFEAGGRTARGGMKTQQDDRFLRTVWECNPALRHTEARVPLCRGGSFSPFYADITITTDWWDRGRRPRAAYEVRAIGRGWGGIWA